MWNLALSAYIPKIPNISSPGEYHCHPKVLFFFISQKHLCPNAVKATGCATGDIGDWRCFRVKGGPEQEKVLDKR